MKFGGGPVGLSTLAVALGEEPDTIEDVYEPYLLQLGFLQRTPRGRVITELGRAHVGSPRDEGEPLLSGVIWTPAMAGPLDELVQRILRRVDALQGGARRSRTRRSSVELVDGSLYRLKTISAEPGFGFVSFARTARRASPRRSSSRSARSASSASPAPSRRAGLGFAGSTAEG